MTDTGTVPLLDRRGLAKNRIEALADGIFAVAMTLLVLDIKSPQNLPLEATANLLDHLVALEHSFAMYVISFIVLAIFWIAHHLLFHFVRHVDRRLLWINMLFLLLVTFVPFSTDLLGLGALLALQVRYLASRPELAAPDLTSAAIANMQREVTLYALVPLVSMAVSFYNPRLGMYSYLLLAIPTFAPSRLDRQLHPAPGAAGNTSDDP